MNVSLKLEIKMLKNTVGELKDWFKYMDTRLGKLDSLANEALCTDEEYDEYEKTYILMDSAISRIDSAISILEKLTPIKII